MLSFVYAKRRKIGLYAKRHYAECRHAECRGALQDTAAYLTTRGLYFKTFYGSNCSRVVIS